MFNISLKHAKQNMFLSRNPYDSKLPSKCSLILLHFVGSERVATILFFVLFSSPFLLGNNEKKTHTET